MTSPRLQHSCRGRSWGAKQWDTAAQTDGRALGSWATRVFPGPSAAAPAHPVSGSAKNALNLRAAPESAHAPDLAPASAPVGAPDAHERAAGDTEWSRQFVRCAPLPDCVLDWRGRLLLLACTRLVVKL